MKKRDFIFFTIGFVASWIGIIGYVRIKSKISSSVDNNNVRNENTEEIIANPPKSGIRNTNTNTLSDAKRRKSCTLKGGTYKNGECINIPIPKSIRNQENLSAIFNPKTSGSSGSSGSSGGSSGGSSSSGGSMTLFNQNNEPYLSSNYEADDLNESIQY